MKAQLLHKRIKEVVAKGPYAGWGLYVKVETNEGLFLLSGAEDSVVGVGIVGAVVVAGLALKFLLKR